MNVANPHPVTSSRILVVEDEPKTRAAIVEGLQLEGWSVAAAATGDEAVRQLKAQAFDLIVLDWMLPGPAGLELLEHERHRGSGVAVLMLTARTAMKDRLRGFDRGADDYLTKPFELAELVARCRALLRRSDPSTGRLLGYADLSLDTRARVATRGGNEVPLTPREVDILECLLRYQGQIVTREMLERDVWRQPRRFTSLDSVIDVHIANLRRKVDAGGFPKLIHTLRGQGYRLGKENE